MFCSPTVLKATLRGTLLLRRCVDQLPLIARSVTRHRLLSTATARVRDDFGRSSRQKSRVLPSQHVESNNAPGHKSHIREDHTPEIPGLVLRPYQTEAIEACLKALERGKRRIGVSSPTGSGKTTMFMHLIPRVAGDYPVSNVKSEKDIVDGQPGLQDYASNEEEYQGIAHPNRLGESPNMPGPPSSQEQDYDAPPRTQTLILVGSVELALQSQAAAERILGDKCSVEVEQSRRVASGRADVTVATYQTLNNPDRLAKFDPARFKLVIVDEAHHAASLSYLRLLHYFNDSVELPQFTGSFTSLDHGHKVPIIGFSATFSRHDQLALSAVFEEIVFHREVGHMLDQGWLSPVKSTAVYADLHLDEVDVNRQGDYKTSSLVQHVDTASTNKLVVRTYLHKASNRRSTLVFACNLKHVNNLVQEFRSVGVDARSVSSLSLPADRKATIEAFAAGEFPVLVNCEVLTEGTDIREIDCIILARPTRSRNLLAQMVGRGLRLSPETGKVDCYLIDIADNISRASGLLVAPTLFGLTHEDVVNQEAERSRGEGRAAAPSATTNQSSPHINRVTFVDSEDPFCVHEPQFTPLAKASPNAWVACGRGKFVLEMMSQGFCTIEPCDNPSSPWSISYSQKLPPELRSRSPFGRKQQISLAPSLDRAFETADKFAERRTGFELSKQLRRTAPWRSRPASPKQLAMLLKMKGVEVDGKEGDETVTILGKTVPVGELKAGIVANYVTAASHGAMSVRDKALKAVARTEAKARAAEEKRRLDDLKNVPMAETAHL